MHVAINIITLADSEIIVMGTNIDTVVVAYDDIKYINWAIMKEVTSDGSFFASLIQASHQTPDSWDNQWVRLKLTERCDQ